MKKKCRNNYIIKNNVNIKNKLHSKGLKIVKVPQKYEYCLR